MEAEKTGQCLGNSATREDCSDSFSIRRECRVCGGGASGERARIRQNKGRDGIKRGSDAKGAGGVGQERCCGQTRGAGRCLPGRDESRCGVSGWEPGVSSHLRAPVFAPKLEGRSPRSRVKQREPPSRWRRAHQRAEAQKKQQRSICSPASRTACSV